MRTSKRAFLFLVLASIAVVAAAMIGVFFWRAYVNKRSVPGHIVRSFSGEARSTQMVNDLAEDIRAMPASAKLQPWAVDTLARFRAGQVRTNGSPSWYWKGQAIKLSPQERPDFVRQQWGETNKWGEEWPEIYVVLSDRSEPESIAIVWGLHGVIVGPPEYPSQSNAWYAHDYAEAIPGVYVFHENK